VFIGAGYTIESEDMLKKVDKGLDSRFRAENRLIFADYTLEDLGLMLTSMAKSSERSITLSSEVHSVAVQSIMQQQRALMNPSNGRGVELFLAAAKAKQEARVFELLDEPNLDDAKITAMMSSLALEDVKSPPRVSIDDVFAKLESKFVGLSELRTILKSIQSAEKRAIDDGNVLDVSYNFILQGSAGTGKTSVAEEIIGPFFCALDVISSSTVVIKKGADMLVRQMP